MTRIFLSYAHEDQPSARRIVDALAREGLEAWWDHQIPPGRSWDEVIGGRIDAADAVIVIWSDKSIASDFVKEEAQLAFNAGKLLPVKLSAVEPPVGFRRVQAADLVTWRGENTHPQWRALVDEIRSRLGVAASPGAKIPPPRSRIGGQQPLFGANKPLTIGIAAVAALVVLLGVAGFIANQSQNANPYASSPYEPPPAAAEVEPAPAAAIQPATATVPAGDPVENLLGWWTRTSGTVCRESYGFRRQGSQIVWNQNEDQYTRNYAVYGDLVGLDSTWRFRPRGNTLTIYDSGEQICTFRRGRSQSSQSPTLPSIAGTRWRGVVANDGRDPYVITYQFNQDGSAEWRFEDNEDFRAREFHRWSQSGNRIHFHFEDESGRQNYDGVIRGDVMEGNKTGLLTGSFRFERQR